MEDDSYWVDPDLDDGKDRIFWFCKNCPKASECSPASWKRASVISQNFETMVGRLRRHLMNSEHHLCLEEEAEDLASQIFPDCYTETKEDRDAYRAEMEKKEQKEAKSRKSRKKEERTERTERSRSRDRMMDSCGQALRDATSVLQSIAANAESGASSSVMRATTGPTMNMTLKDVQTLYRLTCKMTNSTRASVCAAESSKLSRRIRQVVRSTMTCKAFKGT